MKTNTITHQPASPLPGQFLNLWQILIRPTAETFRAVGANHAGRFASSLIMAVLTYAIASQVTYVYFQLRPDFVFSYIAALVMFFPLLCLFWVFFIHQLYKKLFGRSKDHYAELAYILFLAITLSNLFDIPFLWIPDSFKTYTGWLPTLYLLILAVVAVSSITKLRWWQSVITVVLSTVISVIISFMGIIFIFSVMRALPGAVSF